MEQADAFAEDLNGRKQSYDELTELYQKVLTATEELSQQKAMLKQSKTEFEEGLKRLEGTRELSASCRKTVQTLEAQLSKTQTKLTELAEQQTKTEEIIQRLTQQRSKLGFFAGREKKELTAEIEKSEKYLEYIKTEYEKEQGGIDGAKTAIAFWKESVHSDEELEQKKLQLEEDHQKQASVLKRRIIELERFLSQNESARELKDTLARKEAAFKVNICKNEYDERNDESTESFYICAECQQECPNHVCVVTPDRPGACGKVSWVTAKASAEQNPNGPCKCVSRGVCTDPVSGNYTGVDAAVEKYTNGAINRVNLYSMFHDPMTAANDFECVCGVEPISMGVIITCRGHKGITPLGMNYSEMMSMTAGGIQTPGFMGHSKSYIFSRKFIAAEGGPARIVWMPSKLKNEIRDQLDATALELHGIKWFTDMIADETVCTDDPEELLNYLSSVNHPVLGMDPIEM